MINVKELFAGLKRLSEPNNQMEKMYKLAVKEEFEDEAYQNLT